MSQDQALDELKEHNNQLRLEVQELKFQAEMAKLMTQLDNRNKELENKKRELQHRDSQLDALKQLLLQKYDSEATGSGGIAGNVLTRPTQPANPRLDPQPEENVSVIQLRLTDKYLNLKVNLLLSEMALARSNTRIQAKRS